jgi:hypothetical protein
VTQLNRLPGCANTKAGSGEQLLITSGRCHCVADV